MSIELEWNNDCMNAKSGFCSVRIMDTRDTTEIGVNRVCLVGAVWPQGRGWCPFEITPDHLLVDSALILDHLYHAGKLTISKIADTKVSGF